ncbi:MAG: ATP-binding protein [Bdellovibrio sp.]|nr:ATP-binding protein [Bdellovibrio sp.]
MSATLADYLQIWGFEQDYIVFSDGSFGFALDCVPVDVSTWSDERINAYSERVAQFLNSLPAQVDIQFVQDIEPGNRHVIDRHKALSDNSNNDTAKSLCLARVERLQACDAAGELPVHRLKVFVRRPLSQNLLAKPTLLSKEKLFQDISEIRLTSEVELTARLKENIIQGLSGLEISARELGSDQVADLLYQQWNPSRGVPFQSYDPEEVRQSLLFSDIGIDISGFVIGTTFFRLLSLKVLPDQTFASMAARLRELPFKSRLSVTVHVPEQMKEIESLQTQRRIAYSMVVGKKTGVSDIESTAKFQDLETLLEQMIAQGQKVFHVSMTVLLQSEIETELEPQIDAVLSKFRELGGAEAMTETLAAFEIFSQVALPNARSKERSKRIKTANLCDLIPLYGPWPGHDNPRILLKSRMGSLLSLDGFDSSLSNANQLISGGSGSGKSFMMNLLLLQMLKENPKIYFIDIGGSYKKLTENLSGQYVELGVNDTLSVNPFDLGQGEVQPPSHKIKFLVGLVELMTKEEGSDRIPKLARAEIEESIQEVYRQAKKPRLSDLRELLLKHPDREIQTYGKILSPWCGDTPFGKFLDRETTIELQNDIVAFDLKGLESYPDLQSVCLYIITDLVWREVQRDRSRMKFIIFDECWKLLKDEAGLTFIEEVFRTVRKYFCSATAISQDLLDFLNSGISSALLPNCSVKWILMQNQSDFTKMKEAVGLNDNEVALIQSLHQEKGEFSEAFLLAGPERRTVAVIEPTPLELWIATTDPRDLSVIDKVRKENSEISQIEVLKLLAKRFPRGVSASERAKS